MQMQKFLTISLLSLPITVASFTIAFAIAVGVAFIGAPAPVVDGIGWTIFGTLIGTSFTAIAKK
jgi:hypothetical protein